MQLVTAYWMLRYPGLQAAAISDSDDNRDYFRDNLLQICTNACNAAPFRINNQSTTALENGSRLLHQVSGVRTGTRLGVGRGVAFAHGTEVALWSNPNAITYLRTRFSDVHPQRLFVFESTARGRNWWWEMWEEAAGVKDIVRVFLAWWMREDYAFPPGSELYRDFWDGRLTARERRWAKEIGRRYRRQLTPGQWAWRRWFVKYKASGDDRMADQEVPTLVEDSFEATGMSFLSREAVYRARKTVAKAPTAKHLRYEFGFHLEDTRVKATNARLGN
jgi:hypothetical protein